MIMAEINLPEPVEFEWDQHNEDKIFIKHKISKPEAEQVFFNFYLSESDEQHSKSESRYSLLGISNFQRIFFVIFTVRGKKIILTNLKPTSRSISIRIPEYLISQVKSEANKLDIPYQSLMKQYISQG